MRLLNVSTRELHEFPGENLPPYAIFSHVGLGSSEVSYLEWKRLRQHSRADRLFLNCDPSLADEAKVIESKPGYLKIGRFIEALAKVYPSIKWAHMHNVCVDRSSSAEVDEALNSSYGWCRRAATCLAFLDDVPVNLGPLKSNPQEFARARWFRRSWTLTELIAPPEVRFLDCEFQSLSTRSQLSDIIRDITKIDERFLAGPSNPKSVPAAHRITWAAKRETSRPEDVAYSLMGLLDVYMTPRYGEGKEQAFLRLQEKLLKRTGDPSLLAWGFHGSGAGTNWTPAQRSGPFACHPAQFAACKGMVLSVPVTTSQIRPAAEFKVTNRGVWITTTLVRPQFADITATFSTDYVYAVLGCSFEKGAVLLPLLPARRKGEGASGATRPSVLECDEFWRAPSCTPITVRSGLVPLDPSLRRTVLILRETLPVEILSLQIQGLDSAGYRMALQEVWPPTVCRDGVHYIPLDDGHHIHETMTNGAGNGDRRSRSNSSGRNGSAELGPLKTLWILLRLWTYFDNVIVMIRYRGRPLHEGPAGLLPPLSPRQINPVDVEVKVLSLAQFMENYSSPISEDTKPLPPSLEDYFWNREPTDARLEALFAMRPHFRHSEPVRVLVKPPPAKPTPPPNEKQENKQDRKVSINFGQRLPKWTIKLEFDKAQLGNITSLGGL